MINSYRSDAEMTIRPYEEKDKENVRFVCLNSEGPCKSSKRGINFGLAKSDRSHVVL